MPSSHIYIAKAEFGRTALIFAIGITYKKTRVPQKQENIADPQIYLSFFVYLNEPTKITIF